jgi:alanine dehydrogenase
VRIGVAREVKTDEYRVALTPAGARELVQRGHEVLVEAGAGMGSRFADGEYAAVGAVLVGMEEVWGRAELLLKVKEPVEREYGFLREGLVLFTYLHVAADRGLARAVDVFDGKLTYEAVAEAHDLDYTPLADAL